MIFSEWAVNIQRDSLASYIGHSHMLTYFSVALNESSGRIKYDFLERMLAPCGPPPPTGFLFFNIYII